MKPPQNAYNRKKVSSGEQVARRLANPETGAFENYLLKVMNSVKHRKRGSLAPEASEPIIAGLPYNNSVPGNVLELTGMSQNDAILEYNASFIKPSACDSHVW